MQIEEPDIQEYPLTKVKLEDLVFDKSNPNRPSKEVIEGIRKSILEFGLVKPIVINEKMEIADGEHRALVWKALGKTDIQAYIVPKLNDDIKRRLARQTLNKLQGEHDIKLDADEMALIFEAGQLNNLAELIAQGRESLENILTKHKGIQFQHEDNFDVDKALEDLVPTTQLGDIWQLGNHRIICADCTDKRSIDRLLENKKIDMVFTDPPYGIDLETDYSKLKNTGGKGKQYDKVLGDTSDYNPDSLFDMFGYCDEIFLFGADYYIDKIPDRLKGNLMVWDKTLVSSGDCTSNNLSEFELFWSKQSHKRRVYHVTFFRYFGLDKEDCRQRLHPTQKPIELIKQIFNDYGKEGDTIIDPFLGSGSTMIACEQTNRICMGVEIDPHYVDVCCKRWEAYTGNKAVKL